MTLGFMEVVYSENSIRMGVLLAAGRGLRLYPLTRTKPKCLVQVNGKSILERLISSLNACGIDRLIVVTGYKDTMIRDFLEHHRGGIAVSYVYNGLYETTNNIYSLYLARNMINAPFLLMESDIIFQPALLRKMTAPDRIAIADPAAWMNGTTVVMNRRNRVKAFQTNIPESTGPSVKKTVNMYSFSLPSWKQIEKQLKKEISRGKVTDYYETVFKTLVDKDRIALQGVSFDAGAWYEIDTVDDLAAAEKLFLRSADAARTQSAPETMGIQQVLHEEW